eukprot:876754-Rhodomonas_salina.1
MRLLRIAVCHVSALGLSRDNVTVVRVSQHMFFCAHRQAEADTRWCRSIRERQCAGMRIRTPALAQTQR